MSEHTPRHLKLLTLVYAATLVLLVAAADRGALMVTYLAGLPAVDKVGHFLLIGLLSYLVNACFGGRRLRWKRISVLQSSALLAVLVACEELSQLALTHRSFELTDLAADAAGIWFFGRLSRFFSPSANKDRIEI